MMFALIVKHTSAKTPEPIIREKYGNFLAFIVYESKIATSISRFCCIFVFKIYRKNQTYGLRIFATILLWRSLLDKVVGRCICWISCVSAENRSSFHYWTRRIKIPFLQWISLQSLHVGGKCVVQNLQRSKIRSASNETCCKRKCTRSKNIEWKSKLLTPRA